MVLSSSGPEPNINLFPTAIQNGHINLIIRCVIGLADEPPTPSDGIKSGCPPFRRGIKLRRVLVMAHSDVGRRDASPTSSMKSVFYAVKHQVNFSTSSSSRTWCRLRLGVRAAAPSSVCTVRSHEYGIVSCVSGPRGRSYRSYVNHFSWRRLDVTRTDLYEWSLVFHKSLLGLVLHKARFTIVASYLAIFWPTLKNLIKWHLQKLQT